MSPSDLIAIDSAVVIATPSSSSTALMNCSVATESHPGVTPGADSGPSELTGAPATAATWQAAGELAAAAIDPPSDGHASGDYRKRLAATLVTRALTEAAGA